MPQTSSAKKYLRVNARKRVVNDRWRRQVHEALLSVRNAIKAGQQKPALEAYTKVQSLLDRAARRNVIHPNKAARKKSRLQAAIRKLAT